MNTILSALVAVAVFAGSTTAAADKPNFSGEWKLNTAKSSFGPLPGPSSIVRKVTHNEPSLVIVEDQQGDMGAQNTTRTYTTDGKDVSFDAGGTSVKGSAAWDANTLVVISKVDAASLQFTDRMSMSDDGRTLTSLVHISAPQGEVDLTLVFDKQ